MYLLATGDRARRDQPLADELVRLRDAGPGSLPGTAAEFIDDEIRAVIRSDKLDAAQWLVVMDAAHRVGLESTATTMFGHASNAPLASTVLLRREGHRELCRAFEVLA